MSNSTTKDHEFANHVWDTIRSEWRNERTIRRIMLDIPYNKSVWPNYPLILISASGQISDPSDIRASCYSQDIISIRMPLDLDDVLCDVSLLGSILAQAIVHELEHTEQLACGIMKHFQVPNLVIVQSAELNRATAWLNEYYNTEIEIHAHARMLAVAMVEKFGHPARALDNINGVIDCSVWRLIASRIYSSITTEQSHVKFNESVDISFRDRLLQLISDQLKAMEIGG